MTETKKKREPIIICLAVVVAYIVMYTLTIMYVNAIAPGFVHTRYIDSISEEMKENWLKNIPIKKFITPEEIAEVYLMLATSTIFAVVIIRPFVIGSSTTPA